MKKRYEAVPYGANKIVREDWEWYHAETRTWRKTTMRGSSMWGASNYGTIKYRRPVKVAK